MSGRGAKRSGQLTLYSSVPEDGQPSEIDQVGEFFAAPEWHAHVTSVEDPVNFWNAQITALDGRRLKFSRDHTQAIERKPGKPAILYLENDEDLALEYGMQLEQKGFEVVYAFTPRVALEEARRNRHFLAAILDVKMAPGDMFGGWETVYGRRAGLAVGRELLQILQDVPFIGLSRFDDSQNVAWFEAYPGFKFCSKSDYSAPRFARFVYNLLMEKPLDLKAFIVHGHDQHAVLDLKNFLQSRLKMPEPIVLHERASGTLTIIEKFEKYAADIDIAFILLTPDDFADPAVKKEGRARQNVIFELGYFVGSFGRKSGRVILLTKTGVEIPNDLAGVVYIDITNGVVAAGEKIRTEIEAIVAAD